MSSPPYREDVFNRITKGDSYFLHQVRKNRKKQFTRKKNSTPFDAIDQSFGGNNGLGEAGISGRSSIGSHDSRNESSSKLDSYLGQLKDQHTAKEQWKRNFELQKEQMDDWTEELKQKISQVDKIKEEIKENQQKHEEALRDERKHLETEFNAKKLRLQKKEVSLYKLMEDTKNRTDKNAQKERYLDLREEEMRVLMEQWKVEKNTLQDQIEKLKDIVKKQEHQILIMEKKLLIAEQDKIQYDKDRRELEASRLKIIDIEEQLRRATVERERYATDKEIELKEKEKQLNEREKQLELKEPKCEEILKRETEVQQKEYKIKESEIKLEKKTLEIEQTLIQYEKKRIDDSKERQIEIQTIFEEKRASLEKEYQEKIEMMKSELELVKQEKESVKQEKEAVSKTLQESQLLKNSFMDKLAQLSLAQNPRATLQKVSGQAEKRITYFSHVTEQMSESQMEDIIKKSIAYNRTQGITSILISMKNLLLQVIEGEAFEVDTLFARIYKDLRHERVQVVNIEDNIKARKYPESFLHFVPLQEPVGSAFAESISKLKFDQEIIENYIQPTVLGMVKTKINPITLPCMRKNRIIVQCEMFRFNDFAQYRTVESLKDSTDQYFNLCSRIIHRNGGQVSSFREDTIIAYFEVHLLSQAIGAAVDISKRLHLYREQVQKDENNLKATFVGIGITKGPTIEGTIGGPVLKQYAVLGPTVRRARLLQYFSRQSNHFVVFDEKIKADLENDPDFKDLIVDTGFMENGNIKCHTFSLQKPFIEYSPSQVYFRLKSELARHEKERQNELTLQRLQQRGAKLEEELKDPEQLESLIEDDIFSIYDDEDTFVSSRATPHKAPTIQTPQKPSAPQSTQAIKIPPAQPKKNSLMSLIK